jgi:NADPH-dependent glutamate synthase beta subunit-like oxidoreductase
MAQVREILDLGITLKLNARLGRDFSLTDLHDQGFNAVFLALGLHRSRDLSVPGNDLDGVIKGIDFLLNVNQGYRFSIGKKVVVIGGGNVAIDVARSALREQQRISSDDIASRQLPDALSSSEQQVAMNELMDVSRAALRMGAREVHLVCLESREEMPALEDEVEEGEREGLIVHPSLGPQRFLGKGGRVTGVETIRCTSVFDAEHRFNTAF